MSSLAYTIAGWSNRLSSATYTIAGWSNRLSSLAEAAGASAETWDAEAGSFTYDANGNVAISPAPYSLTAMSHDPRNLPLSLTRSGVTTGYRYNCGGRKCYTWASRPRRWPG